jgi:transcriptional regulator with XRE-family HTH domain
MDKKLRILMQNENLSASKLADILEIKPAAVSHILSGRNKPSFELICKIVNRFPHINPYWLLGDSLDILNSNAQIPTSQNFTENEATLFDDAEKKVENPEMTTVSEPTTLPSLSRSDIEKIIIVYRDQTFEELRPKKI